MNKEITTPQSSQADPTGVVLQQEKEGDTSSHLIAGLVAAEFGVTLTANWLLSGSVTSTTASLGYIGVAVFAWGTVSVLNSIPTLLATTEEDEQDLTIRAEQNGEKADNQHKTYTEQDRLMANTSSEVSQTETTQTVPVFHAETSLPATSVQTAAS